MHKILIADDEAVIALRLKERLTSMGYKVVGMAASGEEAIDMAKRFKPGLILMDIVMPGKLDGIEASETIKAELDIPIIFLTAYADDEFVRRAKNVGPFGYIVKPFRENELRAAIEIALYKKELEAKLQASEEQFRAIVETTPSLLLIYDAESKIAYVSPNCKKITGYTQKELQRKGTRWVHKDDISRVNEVFERTFHEGEGAKDFEYRAVKKNGELWCALSSCVPLRDSEGTITGILMQTIDITERKKAEEALRQSEERYHAVVENSVDEIMMLDKDGRYLAINTRAAASFGFKPKEMANKTLWELLPNEQADDLFEPCKKVFDKKRATTQINQHRNVLGKGFKWVQSIIAPVRGENKDVEAVVIISRDITKQKEIEQDLKETSSQLTSIMDLATEYIIAAYALNKKLISERYFED